VLAYAYAASGEEGSANVVRSVSRLLYGIPIEKYVTIDLAGLSTLTDTIGGVSVTSLENITLDGTPVKTGQAITLTGKQAINYIQLRDNDTEANNRRMSRQKQFLTAFMGQVGQLLQENMTRLPGLYNTAKPYIVSNVTLSELTYMASTALPGGGWQYPTYHTITGESVMGEKHVEFYANDVSVFEAVLATFYTPES
jgi:LCP family protein required for cell wall assembly